MANYDRRSGGVEINRLTPMAEQARDKFKEGLQQIETALNLIKLVEQEAREQLPKHHIPPPGRWQFTEPSKEQRRGDAFWNVMDYARELRKMVEEKKPYDLKKLAQFFDEFASETKANMDDLDK